MKRDELTIRIVDSDGIPLEEYQDDPDLVQSDLVSSAFIEVPPADKDQLHFALSPIMDRGVQSIIILNSSIQTTKEGSFANNLYKLEALSVDIERPPSTKEKSVDLGSIGIIEVRAWRVKNARKDAPQHGYAAESAAPKKILEKLLKGKDTSHGVRGIEQALQQYRSRVFNSYRSDKETVEPFHNFRFYYRTKAALRPRGVIPRTPSPEPELDPVEAELEKARQQVAELERQLKRKNGEIKEEPGRAVKRERTTAAPKGPKKTVVIDLTEE